jgi:hypothetical protein
LQLERGVREYSFLSPLPISQRHSGSEMNELNDMKSRALRA